MNNRFNEVFSSFNPYNSKFSSGSKIIDNFHDYFSFYFFSKYSNDQLISCSYQLDNLAIMSSKYPLYALVVTDISIKNNVAIFITHIHIYNRLVVMILILRVEYKNNSCIRKTQENSIRNSLQNSLPYILLQMVHANYCAPYPK